VNSRTRGYCQNDHASRLSAKPSNGYLTKHEYSVKAFQ